MYGEWQAMTMLQMVIFSEYDKTWLRAERQPDSYSVGPVPFNLSEGQIADVRRYGQEISGGVSQWISLRTYTEAAGEILFSALMESASIENLYRATLAEVRISRQSGYSSAVLYLYLTFNQELFHPLPWELMFDPKEGLFLITSNHISISRSPALPVRRIT